MPVFLRCMCVLLLSLSLTACKPAPQTLALVAGSENKALEALVTQLGRQHGVQVAFTYLGSVDIGREIQKGTACTYDAVWPASSLWIALSDTQHVVKHAQSIMRSPVVFAVKKPVAEQLGWLGKEIRVRDILSAAETGRLRFAMTSATQSNSGASAYLGYLHAFAGNPDVLTEEHLRAPAVQEQVSHFLGQVHRQTGSSGWLMDLLLERYDQFDAVVNYEALVIEANQKLTVQGRPPLYAFYVMVYSWEVVTAALLQRGLVTQRDTASYSVDLAKLIALVEAHTSWAELGLPQLYGTIKILATDPARSNSGNSFAGLLATLLNNGEVIAPSDTARLATLLPRVQTFFARMGFLEHSSGVLWDKFISQGAGAYPLIIGYENQLVEYSVEHPEALQLLGQQVRTLYPVPTVWSSHPFIALTAKGVRLLEALHDPTLQRIAWERHGFRSGFQGITNDPRVLRVTGLPASIDAVIPMPPAAIMTRVLETVRATP